MYLYHTNYVLLCPLCGQRFDLFLEIDDRLIYFDTLVL